MKKRRTGYARGLTIFLFLLVCCGVITITLTACLSQNANSAAIEGITLKTSASGEAGITYMPLLKERDSLFEGPLILVNNEYPYSGSSPDATSIYKEKNASYFVKDKTVELDRDTIESLNRMMADFSSATGKADVMMISGVRSFDKQQETYEAALAKTGASSSSLAAKPGYSEHHTGYALDFGLYGIGREFDGTGDYRWLNQNCAKYGFIVRYLPEKAEQTQIDYEPWHFRYVGKPHAEIISQKGFCLEEYIDFLRQYPYSGNHLHVTDADGKSYEIYYVAASGEVTSVAVPTDRTYQISGNNADGFIVTVNL